MKDGTTRWRIRYHPAMHALMSEAWPADRKGRRWMRTEGVGGPGRDPLRLVEDPDLTNPTSWFVELDDTTDAPSG